MKKLWMLLLAAFFCLTLFAAESDNKAELKVDGVTTQITFYSPEIVRVRCPHRGQGGCPHGGIYGQAGEVVGKTAKRGG